jgi:hypothetical protein
VEVMSDEEERFVDEAARRGAAAASMRLRDRMVLPLPSSSSSLLLSSLELRDTTIYEP